MIKKASHGEGNEDQSLFRLLKKQMKEKFEKKNQESLYCFPHGKAKTVRQKKKQNQKALKWWIKTSVVSSS